MSSSVAKVIFVVLLKDKSTTLAYFIELLASFKFFVSTAYIECENWLTVERNLIAYSLF